MLGMGATAIWRDALSTGSPSFRRPASLYPKPKRQASRKITAVETEASFSASITISPEVGSSGISLPFMLSKSEKTRLMRSKVRRYPRLSRALILCNMPGILWDSKNNNSPALSSCHPRSENHLTASMEVFQDCSTSAFSIIKLAASAN